MTVNTELERSSDVEIFAKRRALKKRKFGAVQAVSKPASERKSVNTGSGGGKVSGRDGKDAVRNGKDTGRCRKDAVRGGIDGSRGRGGKISGSGRGGSRGGFADGKARGALGGRGRGNRRGGKADSIRPDNSTGRSNEEKERRRKSKMFRRRKRPVAWSKEKLEANKTLEKEIAGRVDECNRRTLYVCFPTTLVVKKAKHVKEALGDAAARGDLRLFGLKQRQLRSCLIEYETEDEAKKSKDTINDVEFKGEKFSAEFVRGKHKRGKATRVQEMDSCKLHVGLLPVGTTRLDLRNVFSTSCRIDFPRKRVKGIKNFAFIIYKTKEEALRVFNASRHIKVNDKVVKVTFAKYRPTGPKHEKKPKFENEQQETQTEKDVAPTPTKKIKVEEDTKQRPSENNADSDEVDDIGDSYEDIEDEDENEECKSDNNDDGNMDDEDGNEDMDDDDDNNEDGNEDMDDDEDNNEEEDDDDDDGDNSEVDGENNNDAEDEDSVEGDDDGDENEESEASDDHNDDDE